MIRIALAEDYHVVREGIASMLGREPDMQIVGQTADGDQVRHLLKQTFADILILDAKMPGPSVTDQVALVQSLFPDTRVLVLSAFKLPEYVRGVIREGALGYVLKDDAPEMLVEAVREVARGGRYFSPRIEEIALYGREGIQARDPAGLLTVREHEVLFLIANGNRTEQIADTLTVSNQTVKNYCQSIFRKLGVNSRVEAVVSGIKLGIVDTDDLSV